MINTLTEFAQEVQQGLNKTTKTLPSRYFYDEIGDDLFVTQVKRLRRGINNRSAHAILIKPNQNGSMVGTFDVMKYAKENDMQCVVSHRSGETLDSSIADMAMATGALGIKTGDPQPEEDFPDAKTWVRRRKYLRMIELEESQRD